MLPAIIQISASPSLINREVLVPARFLAGSNVKLSLSPVKMLQRKPAARI
jgi:hypothetical protein